MGTGSRARADHVVALRRAKLADLDDMQAIELASFSDPWSRHGLAMAISSPDTIVIVAETEAGSEKNGDISGYSILARAGDEAELLNLAVAAGDRGRGIGAALLERTLSEAGNWDLRAVFLEVRASNSAALRLYERAGFERVGRRPGYYRRPSEDALILRRLLS